jgi:hypothetical protein
MFEAQPYVPYSIVLNGRNAQSVTVMLCEGAFEAAEAAFAPRGRKVPALPAPGPAPVPALAIEHKKGEHAA